MQMLKRFFEFSKPLIGIFIHFPVKFQNTFLVPFQKSYLIFKVLKI